MPDIQSSADIDILVEFPDGYGLVQASRGGVSDELKEKSKEALDKAMNTIVGMAYRASELRDKIPAEFTQAEIEFAVKLSYEAGALLSKAGGEGAISVKLTWERPQTD